MASGLVVPFSQLDEAAEAFVDSYTCVTFDHRGSGDSPPALKPLTTARMAADALSVLDELGIESAHVYGISLGGMVAQELALAAPDRVKALVLGATTAGGLEGYPRTLWATFGTVSGGHHRMPVEFSATTVRSVLTQAWAALTHDAGSRLGRIHAPTLVLHGAGDRLLPVANGRALASLIPGAEFRIIEGAGHLYAYNARTGACATVLDWLANAGDAAPAGVGAGHASCARLGRAIWQPLADGAVATRHGGAALAVHHHLALTGGAGSMEVSPRCGVDARSARTAGGRPGHRPCRGWRPSTSEHPAAVA